jgi:hypothetical protein
MHAEFGAPKVRSASAEPARAQVQTRVPMARLSGTSDLCMQNLWPRNPGASTRQRVHKSRAHVSKSHTMWHDSIRVSDQAMQQSMGLILRIISLADEPATYACRFWSRKIRVLLDSACWGPEPVSKSHTLWHDSIQESNRAMQQDLGTWAQFYHTR